jgi:hypothetical protein
MNILQLAIYAYIALVFVCLVLVTIGFITRRILGARDHTKLMNDLRALTPRLKTLPSDQQEVAGNLSSLILPIDHYGWSGDARKELRETIDSIASEANRVEEKVAAEKGKQETRKNQSIAESQNATQKAEKAAVKAEDAARKAEDAANRVLDLTRQAEEAAAKEAIAARNAQELRANATAKVAEAREAMRAAAESLEKGWRAKATTVPELLAMTTLIAGGSLSLALEILPNPLFSHYLALILRVSLTDKALLDRRLAELHEMHQDEAEFTSEAQKVLDDLARRVGPRRLVTQEGEASEKS